MENNVMQFPSEPVKGLDMSKPHYQCRRCGISVQSIYDGSTCLCRDGIDPVWMPVEMSAPLPPAMDITANSPKGAPVMSWDERLQLKEELMNTRIRRVEFMIDLHQRILYLESALDHMNNSAGPSNPPLEIPE